MVMFMIVQFVDLADSYPTQSTITVIRTDSTVCIGKWAATRVGDQVKRNNRRSPRFCNWKHVTCLTLCAHSSR